MLVTKTLLVKNVEFLYGAHHKKKLFTRKGRPYSCYMLQKTKHAY